MFTAATIPYPVPPLGGATFILRPFRADDFGTALTFAEDPEGVRWVQELPADDGAGVAEFFENSRLNGELLHVVIASRATDAYLGEAMLVPGDDLVAEVGCCVLPTARRQGVATHALRLLTEWAFTEFRIKRVQVFVAVENHAALHLAEAAGFTREGVLRAYFGGTNERSDAIVLSRLPADPG